MKCAVAGLPHAASRNGAYRGTPWLDGHLRRNSFRGTRPFPERLLDDACAPGRRIVGRRDVVPLPTAERLPDRDDLSVKVERCGADLVGCERVAAGPVVATRERLRAPAGCGWPDPRLKGESGAGLERRGVVDNDVGARSLAPAPDPRTPRRRRSGSRPARRLRRAARSAAANEGAPVLDHEADQLTGRDGSAGRYSRRSPSSRAAPPPPRDLPPAAPVIEGDELRRPCGVADLEVGDLPAEKENGDAVSDSQHVLHVVADENESHPVRLQALDE